MIDFTSLITGGVGGTITSFAFKIWQDRKAANRQRVNVQVEEVIADARRLEKVAVDYWLLAGNDQMAQSFAILTFNMVHRIGSLVGILKSDGWIFEGHDVTECIDKLDKICTGGNFQVKTRKPDTDRASKASAAVTDLIVALRVARRNVD